MFQPPLSWSMVRVCCPAGVPDSAHGVHDFRRVSGETSVPPRSTLETVGTLVPATAATAESVGAVGQAVHSS